MFRVDGKAVAGMMPAGEEGKESNTPPMWNTYFATDDVDGWCERVKSLGGTIVAGPMDVMTEGRTAWVSDPFGAVFALWQAKDHVGGQVSEIPGTVTWTEINVKDMEAAKAFYSELCNWRCETQDMGGTPYTVCYAGDEMVAGMIQMNEQWEGVPSHWMTYFTIENCDAAAEKIKELGGDVCVPPTDIPQGRFAVVNDPQKGTFSIFEHTR
ncbi:MAG: VOC family protein [Deltaproteobacteria bacterium]|nr:MAG: VOC family protein [Deltaproteobacteria bacterium]